MSTYPPTLVRLIKELAKFPGIGEKTAERLALYVLKAPERDAEKLASAVLATKRDVRTCSVCFGMADAEVCHICSNPSRDTGLVCVVEQATDLIAIEKSGAHKGLYHVLCGVLSPMDGVGPENLRIDELAARVRKGGITEVVLATGTSVEGDATAAYLAKVLEKLGVTVSRIATGVPVGGDLKYIDALTLKRALDSRRGV